MNELRPQWQKIPVLPLPRANRSNWSEGNRDDKRTFSPIRESGDFPLFSNPYVSTTSWNHVGIRWVMLGYFRLWWLQFSYSFRRQFDL